MHPSLIALKAPDRIALRMAGSGATVSYAELEARSNQLAQLFRSLGLVPGDSLAMMVENHPRYFDICWAAQRSGLIFTALSTRLTDAEAAYIVDDCGARVFVSTAYKADTAREIVARDDAAGGRGGQSHVRGTSRAAVSLRAGSS